MNNPVFILGAGFNRDAKRNVGAPIGHSIYGDYEIQCDYPLVGDLARLCFGRDLAASESIEELLALSIRERNFEPLRRVYDALMEADYRIAPRLLPDQGKSPSQINSYGVFFERFNDCCFLTFNYDSLPELFLLRYGVWDPRDGYGVPVQAEPASLMTIEPFRESESTLVLHLHGSLCIYTSSHDLTTEPGSSIRWLVKKKAASYIFDPDSISSLFFPFGRMLPQATGYVPLEDRVIAPTPDKTDNLRTNFIQAVHCRAKEILASSQRVIVIGYRFNELDRSSYDHLLLAFAESKEPVAVLVSPDAEILRTHLSGRYPRIQWVAQPRSFEQWVQAGFPGVTQ